MAELETLCAALENKCVCRECPKVQNEWDMERLLNDLARAKAEQEFTDGKILYQLKSRELSSHQICWLCLLLLGLSVEQIESRFKRSRLTTDLSKTLFKYVKIVTGKKINHWAQLRLYIEQAGYRKGISIAEEPLEIKIVIKTPVANFHQSIQELIVQLNRVVSQGTMTLETTYEDDRKSNEPESSE